jgi:hypothetical protein
VRLFIDDSERQLGGAWTLEIKSGTVPVELKWVGKAAFFVGDISAASSCHFKRGAEEAWFDADHLFVHGGVLILAFIRNPAVLSRDLSLVDGEVSRIEKFAAYDDARSYASRGWRMLSKKDKGRAGRAFFYHFTPDTDYDPVAVTGRYFELLRR